ncbi:glycerol-3-phosphate dehydrogenase [Dongia soli]|uniref:Glycerol-3-phosphate dehydrogenase n=1 Tax=Dongia soli TaxID=600628 RepID=A0ABU5E4X2_9PROT|nr:glycerol-3-phosphate dehydrogenase [Dongia soli]MDY0881310.1 glycerol-3-phosphate dehydrogenase [Dongia soli]
MTQDTVDLLVVGGGINGTGIARDAAGRGLKVLLAEQRDLASATSSASTKLIHGGLRYLEHYEFRLVREALSEREVLLESAPHIIWPLRFILPHEKSLRPAWMIRIGLFLYDHLGGRKRLPASKRVDLRTGPLQSGLKAEYQIGFAYSDCWVNDARLVALNALDARERGVEVLTRSPVLSAKREGKGWIVEIGGDAMIGNQPRLVRARALVNATGPWAGSFIDQQIGGKRDGQLRLVKGSHIIVPRLYQGEHAFILQNEDRRIVFTIPYEGHFTLVGTTDVAYEGDPAGVKISPEEVDYLCNVVNRHFKHHVTAADVVWNYAGVRPLFDTDGSESASAISRDYVLDLEDGEGGAVLLNVFGGKITTYRRLAEHALQKLQPFFPQAGGDWTAKAHLPGGDIANADFTSFEAGLAQRFTWLPSEMRHRLARAYGTRIDRIIGTALSLDGLGTHFGGDLYESEVRYLIDQEWARSADDVLWRRSKLGLHLPVEAQDRLRAWFAAN